MLDDIKSFLSALENSEQFNIWRESHKNAYLCSAFSIGPDIDKITWQLDFYNPDDMKITSFVEQNNIIRNQEESVFKKPETQVKELNLSKVKVDLKKAIEKLERFKKKKYPKENSTQKIFVLQNLDSMLWNITYITSSFNIFIVKVDAVNGKIISSDLIPIMGFKDKKYDKSAFDKFIK